VGNQTGEGGTNPPIPDPTNGRYSGNQWDNFQNGSPPYVWVQPHDPNAKADANAIAGDEVPCWIQAVESSQIDNPGRVFYLGDGREYGPAPAPNGWPYGTKFDGWGAGYGNQIYIGTRHSGFANMVYMDGHCNSDNQIHYPIWNLAYTGNVNDIRSDTWRVATFADKIQYANIVTQSHHMPQLMVRGWEWFFSSVGKR
jgi:prepilin-type processing-associated H-X9-DG protein